MVGVGGYGPSWLFTRPIRICKKIDISPIHGISTVAKWYKSWWKSYIIFYQNRYYADKRLKEITFITKLHSFTSEMLKMKKQCISLQTPVSLYKSGSRFNIYRLINLISLIWSRLGEMKAEYLEINHLAIHKQNVAFSHVFRGVTLLMERGFYLNTQSHSYTKRSKLSRCNKLITYFIFRFCIYMYHVGCCCLLFFSTGI